MDNAEPVKPIMTRADLVLTNEDLAEFLRGRAEYARLSRPHDVMLAKLYLEAATRLSALTGASGREVEAGIQPHEFIAMAKAAGGEEYGPRTWNMSFKQPALIAFGRAVEERALATLPLAQPTTGEAPYVDSADMRLSNARCALPTEDTP